MDMDGYRQTLLGRRLELSRRLGKISGDLSEQRSAESAERAIESENDEVLESLGQAGENELRGIEAALARMEAGSYGRCVTCDAAIAPERLALLPATPFCQDCAPA
ncbi:TraR/DksA family transcriptional regulator [Agrobacterium vitis]|uniref:TraR/DksA family transcriptional regulator n=1 Tax=Agrobacterium vitis TaxID=373 RepID=UPI0020352C52|nr:TraR/DksA C4-type zinc finger protein [Agrobacterium vitis]MCM2451841.1 TraR/DksA family transcriptional regulator [Agrobacterium vitis]